MITQERHLDKSELVDQMAEGCKNTSEVSGSLRF
jgi:hypothetical protein